MILSITVMVSASPKELLSQTTTEIDVLPAEIIAFAGHGALFDANLNRIEPDSPLIARIQDSLIEEIARSLDEAMPDEIAANLQEAQGLLNSGSVNADEMVIVKSGIIDMMLSSAPDDVVARYKWRNDALAVNHLNFLDRSLETDPNAANILRPGILDMFPIIQLPLADATDYIDSGLAAATCRSADKWVLLEFVRPHYSARSGTRRHRQFYASS